MTFCSHTSHSGFYSRWNWLILVWNLNWKQTLFWIENRKSYSTVLTLFSDSELIKKGISSGKWGAIPVMQPETKTYIHSFILHCNQTLHVASKICKAAPKPSGVSIVAGWRVDLPACNRPITRLEPSNERQVRPDNFILASNSCQKTGQYWFYV